MAHGDALIFLTNIVWIFILFLFIYLFFVVFFLPTFYKKFRIRVLVRTLTKTISVLSVRNILVSLTFFLDFFRGLHIQILGFLASMLYYFNVRRMNNALSFGSRVETGSVASATYLLNKNLFIDGSGALSGLNFVKFKN